MGAVRCCTALDWTMRLADGREVECSVELTDTAGIYQILLADGREVPVLTFYHNLAAHGQWRTFTEAALYRVRRVHELAEVRL